MKARLDRGNTLLFHHIPKAGGLSIITILDKQFKEHEILPLHSVPSSNLWDLYSEEQKAEFRLVRGHFTFYPGDPNVYKHLTKNPIRITMLREPIKRMKSAYLYLRRSPHVEVHVKRIEVRPRPSEYETLADEASLPPINQDARRMSFSELVESQKYHRNFYNRQTRMILGPNPCFPKSFEGPDELAEDELLSLAKD